jgi:hypothetical protein
VFNCAQCAELLPDLLEGKGDPILRRRLLVQTEKCEQCRHCVDTYRKSAELCRQAYRDAEPPETCEHLLDFLRQHLHAEHQGMSRRRVVRA